MNVSLVDQDDIGEWLRGGKHWVFAFGRNAMTWVDEVDKLSGLIPTAPTVYGPGICATFIPKKALSRKRIETWFKKNGVPQTIGPKQDIIIVTADASEAALMMQNLTSFAMDRSA